jgi:hypothetical protein
MTGSVSFCLLEKSAAHHDAIVGPLVIFQVSLEDGRYITDDAQIGRIVLA